MSEFDEGRVIEALRAIRGGLVVTEQDIIEARGRLREQLRPGSPRRPRILVAVVAAAVVALVAAITGYVVLGDDEAGPPPGTPPTSDAQPQLLDPDDWELPGRQFLAGATPTAADLVGLWRIRTSDDAWLMLLGADGYWTTTNGHDLFGGGDAGNRGTWSLRNGRITLHGQEGFLGKGFLDVLDVALMPDGSLHQVSRPAEGRCGDGGSCGLEEEDPGRYLWDRVAPGVSPLLDSLGARGPAVAPELADGYLTGVWVSADGHWVVTVNEEHGFNAFRDTGDPSARPDDNGHVAIDDQGQLTIICRGGTVAADVELSFSDTVPGLLPPAARILGAGLESTCASGLGRTLDWIQVSALQAG